MLRGVMAAMVLACALTSLGSALAQAPEGAQDSVELAVNGPQGAMLGMMGFGASAPLKDLQKKFNFSADAIAAAAREQVRKHKAKAAMAEVPVKGVEMNV